MIGLHAASFLAAAALASGQNVTNAPGHSCSCDDVLAAVVLSSNEEGKSEQKPLTFPEAGYLVVEAGDILYIRIKERRASGNACLARSATVREWGQEGEAASYRRPKETLLLQPSSSEIATTESTSSPVESVEDEPDPGPGPATGRRPGSFATLVPLARLSLLELEAEIEQEADPKLNTIAACALAIEPSVKYSGSSTTVVFEPREFLVLYEEAYREQVSSAWGVGANLDFCSALARAKKRWVCSPVLTFLEPGLVVHAALLDFKRGEGSTGEELGIGVGLSLFRGIFSAGMGSNTSTPFGDDKYVWGALSLSAVVNRVVKARKSTFAKTDDGPSTNP